MTPSLSREVLALIATLGESLFGAGVMVVLDAELMPCDVLWAHVSIRGEERETAVWVGPSKTLLARASRSILLVDTVSDSDLEDAACEFANIVAGNLKAVFAPRGGIGLPVLGAPALASEELERCEVRMGVDGEGLRVLIDQPRLRT